MAPQTPTASAAPADAASPKSTSVRTPAWLGPGMRVTGEILGDEDLSLDGNVEGPISLGGHRLTVGSSGRVAGEVVAREVVVYGAVDGDVRARDRIEVKKAGSLIGDLTTARIVIEDGAYFKGHIEIDRSTPVGADLDTFLSRSAAASLKELKHPEREVDAASREGSRSQKKKEASETGDGATDRAKSKPSRAAFAVGTYKLGDPIATTGLTEFSEMEYAAMGRQFKHERNLHAPPVEFLGYSWNLMLGTVDGQIYKIALFLEFDTKREANPVAMTALQYCTQQLGKPSSQQTGLFIWDTTDGNVILQTAETAEGLGINLFITSSSVRSFEQV